MYRNLPVKKDIKEITAEAKILTSLAAMLNLK